MTRHESIYLAVSRCLILFSLSVVMASGGLVSAQTSPSPVSGDTTRLRDTDRWVLERLCEAAGDNCKDNTLVKYGYQLSRYRASLRAGDSVAPDNARPDSPAMRCWNRCSLYFLDLLPGAHFAHPTVVGVYDRVTGNLQSAAGEWWPVINGNQHVFDTIRARNSGTVYREAGQFGEPHVRKPETPTILEPDVTIVRPGVESGEPVDNMAAPCGVRAVVVNGYKDEDDTFEDDADGMYLALRGLRISDDSIEFVSPYESSHRDYSTSYENLERAIKAVADSSTSAECDEFVFMLSTHGGTVFDEETGETEFFVKLKSSSSSGSIMYGDHLADLLRSVDCKRLTMVVEACKSGWLKDLVWGNNGDKWPANREIRMLLSAGHNGSSFADIDENDKNPDDRGSESIWGYIEAFGTGIADKKNGAANPNRQISFTEAINYAKEMDASGWGATVHDSDPNDISSPHACCLFGATADLAISPECLLTERRKNVDNYGKSQVVTRCTNAPISITVKNQGGSTVPVGTLRLHGSVISQGEVLPTTLTPFANVVLVTDLRPNEERTYKMHWGVRPVFRKGDRVALLAAIESPMDPVTPGICVQGGAGMTACQANQQSCLTEVSVVNGCRLKGCSCITYVGPEPEDVGVDSEQ